MLFSVVNIYIRNKFVNVSKNGDAKIVLSQMRNIQWESWLRSSEYCFHSIFVPDLVMIQINFGIDLRFSKHSIIVSSLQKIWKIAPQSWKFRNMINLLLKCETIFTPVPASLHLNLNLNCFMKTFSYSFKTRFYRCILSTKHFSQALSLHSIYRKYLNFVYSMVILLN